ncbi:MAG: c-type cytochrome [Gammaproteobacteria bacterium]|nr:c-type cytochrome [Gammaproteobacteria bacterium]
MNKLSLAVLACASALLLVGTANAAGNAAAGKTKAEDCADCHGDAGEGDGKKNPKIAGMTVEKFTKAMVEYQDGTRTKSPKMAKAAKGVSAADIADMAAYYATLK